MKKLLNLKIEISFLTLLVWWCLMMLHALRWVFFCYGIMFVHECAHVLAAYVLKCPVERIVIYPFGLCAEIKETESLGFKGRLLLYMAGALVHLAAFILIEWLGRNRLSLVMKEYLMQMNLNYLIFNLMPIYPLDGYQVLLSFIFLFFPYRYAVMFSQLISFLFLWLFFVLSPKTLVILMSETVLLCMNLIRCFKTKKEIHHFYLKRYLFPKDYPVKIHSFEDLYVYQSSIVMNEKGMISEKMLLKKLLKL